MRNQYHPTIKVSWPIENVVNATHMSAGLVQLCVGSSYVATAAKAKEKPADLVQLPQTPLFTG